MTTEEKLAALARVIVRHGERINLAIQEWQADPSERTAGRIEAAVALSNGLREDIDATMSVNDLYVLASDAEPDSPPDDALEAERLRAKLRKAVSQAEVYRVQAEALQEALSAYQADTDSEPHETH